MSILLIAIMLVVQTSSDGKPSVTTRDISLRVPGGEFNSVTVLNTRARRFIDPDRPMVPGASNECVLDAKAPGVIWKIVLSGAAVKADEITVTDDQGTTFAHVCWSSAGGVFTLDAAGNRTGGGPQTGFLAVGPPSAKRLTIAIGTVRIELPTAQ